MKHKNTRISVISLLLVLGMLTMAGVAGAQHSAIPAADGEVVAQSFNGPQGILLDGDGNIWVIDSGVGGEGEIEWISGETGEAITASFGDSAQVARINAADNSVDTIAALPSVNLGMEAIGGARLALLDGVLYATSGQGIGAPDLQLPDNAGGVVSVGADGAVALVANTWEFEVANNPHPSVLDSHPYGLEAGPDGMLYVADAGGNTLLKVDPASGEVSLVAVFGPEPGVFPRPDYGGEMLTDAVPTDVVFDADGNIYVSYLSGAPFVPGTAKVVMVATDGTVSDYATGYTMLTDLAWGPDGNLYGVQFGIFGEQGPTPDSGAVVHITSEGPMPVVEGLSFPIALDFNEAGDLFVAINAVGPPGSGAVIAFRGLAAVAAAEAAATPQPEAEATATAEPEAEPTATAEPEAEATATPEPEAEPTAAREAEPTAAPAPEMLPTTGADLTESNSGLPAWAVIVVAGLILGGFALYRRRVA